MPSGAYNSISSKTTKLELEAGAVQTEWNGVQFSYEVNYEELNLSTEFFMGSYVAKVQVPGLNDCAHKMQDASNKGLYSSLLPLKMCDRLHEPSVPNPYLSQGDTL